MIPHHDGEDVSGADAVGLDSADQAVHAVVIDQGLAGAQVVHDQGRRDFLDGRNRVRIQGIYEVAGVEGHTGRQGASA
ncbi:hypothetical protein D3C71_2046270 [compost metagenome]